MALVSSATELVAYDSDCVLSDLGVPILLEGNYGVDSVGGLGAVLKRSRFTDLFCRVGYTRPSGCSACGTSLFSRSTRFAFNKKGPGAGIDGCVMPLPAAEFTKPRRTSGRDLIPKGC